MIPMLLRAILVILSVPVAFAGVTSPSEIGSDISILTHNDLYGNASWRTDGVLVLDSALDGPGAEKACGALGETLWSPRQSDFLPYLAYQGVNGPFWVNGGCACFDNDGFPQWKACPDSAPALCTSSAPLSNSTHQDNSTQWQVRVKTGGHWLTGFRDRHSFRFEGVRYAPQPERFTYSSVYEAKNDTAALSFGSQCVQVGNVGSEDCLFLNIWSPFLPKDGNTSKSLKPVMFLIHGGAFTGGTGADSTFDGSGLASRGDVVLVTINYRLTTLGFLALDDGVTNGNFGLADQITALDWVRENIRGFGGDPERITIFGQSAGAASVRALMGSPKAIGKFAAAIPQSNLAGSNYATTYSQYYNLSTEISVAAEPILNATGCLNATSTSQVDCLRKVNAHALANLTTVARYLVVDGTYIVSDGLEVTGKGKGQGGGGGVANVPVMMGFMRDDGAAFIGYPKANDTLGTFLPTQGFQLGNTTLDAFSVPSGPNSTLDVFNASALIATDSEFRCLDLATAYSAVNHGTIDTIYFYQFNRSYQTPGYDPNAPVCDAPVEDGYPHGNPEGEYFKCHSGELYYTFGTVAYQGLPDRDGNDIPMAQMTLDRWAAFARTHDPNPDLAFLAARGFTNTTAEVARSGKWDKVGKSGAGDTGDTNTGGQTLRVMQWPSFESSFEFHSSHAQCAALGFPLDYYESAL